MGREGKGEGEHSLHKQRAKMMMRLRWVQTREHNETGTETESEIETHLLLYLPVDLLFDPVEKLADNIVFVLLRCLLIGVSVYEGVTQ